MNSILDCIGDLTDRRSWPSVFINGVFYGCDEETLAGCANGDFAKKVAQKNPMPMKRPRRRQWPDEIERRNAMEFVETEIASAPVVMFSMDDCPLCSAVQQAMKSINQDYKLIELNGRSGYSHFTVF